MAQTTYRANLSAKVFPFISEYFGRSVIIPGPDQNFSRQLASSEDLDKDRGIPQLYYCHNVMPAAEGFQSVGYRTRITDTKSGFASIFTLRDTFGNEVFFSHTSEGKNYILPYGGLSWREINSAGAASDVTVASVNGQSFICFSTLGCYVYNAASNSLLPVALSGLDSTKVLGITSSAGYLIAWTDSAIAWSSTVEHTAPTDPFDFVPSLATGAGGGKVEAARGKITLCVAHYLGFIIYTTDNAIASVYSGNARYPFNLREIVASGGLADASRISYDSGTGNHYAYTTSGMQLVSITQTQTVFPEVTDFLAGGYFEDFDETTRTFVTQVLTGPLKKAVNAVSDRYLVISYGISELTHALVFDLVMKRFGKLRVTHTSCFEWKQIGPEVIETPRSSIGFLSVNGSIKTVDFGYAASNSYGVMLLGKYQLSRSRTVQLQEVSLENVRIGNTFSLYNSNTLDGKTLQPFVPGYLAESSGTYRKYNFHQTGINHTLLFIGGFYCDSLVLKLNVHGRR